VSDPLDIKLVGFQRLHMRGDLATAKKAKGPEGPKAFHQQADPFLSKRRNALVGRRGRVAAAGCNQSQQGEATNCCNDSAAADAAGCGRVHDDFWLTTDNSRATSECGASRGCGDCESESEFFHLETPYNVPYPRNL
jgi:hypothetical protein